MANVAFSPPDVGSLLGDRYRLDRHIARGGMGDVYEATDEVLRRTAAVKVFRSASPTDRARFDAEVHVLAGLGHQGLVRVYDAGSHGADAFVVLELIDGPPLSETLAASGPFPPDDAARLGAEVADALAYIHEHGVVHRDVTPANVLCDGHGRPRLVDFGIARLLDSPRVTTTSLTVGTPAYMAPEQLQESAVTPAADVYALGLVLLEVLTGRRAFEGTVQETAVARLAGGPDLPPDLPGPWRSLLASMTHREPSARPTAAEVRDRLRAMDGSAAALAAPIADADALTQEIPTGDTTQAFATGAGTQVMTVPVLPLDDGPPPRRPSSRQWLPVALLAAAVLAIGALVALAAADGTDPETPTTTTTASTVAPEDDTPAPVVTEPPTTLPPTTLPPATTAPALEVPPQELPFDPDATPPGLERKVEEPAAG